MRQDHLLYVTEMQIVWGEDVTHHSRLITSGAGADIAESGDVSPAKPQGELCML